jgi:hypothetical protein
LERHSRIVALMADSIPASPLTPALALAYLRELSLDVRAAVVLDADGELLAGDGRLADRAQVALAGSDAGPAVRIERSGAEALVCARAVTGVAIAVVAGDVALLPLLAHDVETVLGDLAGAG